MEKFRDTSLAPQERVDDLLGRLTIDEKIGLLATHQFPIPRLGIGEWFVGHEVARGLVNREQEKATTVFPQPLGMAATFDTDLMYQIGLTCGREARAYYNERPGKNGGLMVWGPTVDLVHDPRWGRTEECYGEDPCLSAEMATAYTLGMRRDEKHPAVIPALKHFCANSHEEDRNSDNANLNPRLKHEYYYAAFRGPVVRGGARSVMTAYNDICHAPGAMNHDLKNVLKKEWGLDFVVTDGEDFTQNITHHKCTDSLAVALKACLNAGMDCFTDRIEMVHPAAYKALEEGLITEADIDEAVGNVLRGRVMLGHFDESSPYDVYNAAEHVNTAEDKALNRRAASEGIVLLENENKVLPLNKNQVKSVALFGFNADTNLMDWYTGTTSYNVSIKRGLEERGLEVKHDIGYDIVAIKAPNGKYIRIVGNELFADADAASASRFYLCVHDDQCDWVNLQSVDTRGFVKMEGPNAIVTETDEVYGWYTFETFKVKPHAVFAGTSISSYLHGQQMAIEPETNRVIFVEKQRIKEDKMFDLQIVSSGVERMINLAKEADAVIYCGGNDPEQVARECFDRRSIRLPMIQQLAVNALTAVRPDTVFAIVSSYPYALFFGNKRPGAVLWTSHAGPELGHAFADTIFGDSNPSGRLPITWYAADEDLPDLKNYDIMATKSTYLWFDGKPLYPFGHGLSYSSFTQHVTKVEKLPEGIRFTLSITNTSDIDGTDVIQAYVSAPDVSIPRPIKKLCAFGRVDVAAGQAETISITVPYRELEAYSVSLHRFVLETCEYTYSINGYTATIHVDGEVIPPRDMTARTPAELYDAQKDTEIYTDFMTGETHIRTAAWTGVLEYKNVNFERIKLIEVEASAPVEYGFITVFVDDEEVGRIIVPGSDGHTDWKILPLPVEFEGTHDIRLILEKDVCVKSVSTCYGYR